MYFIYLKVLLVLLAYTNSIKLIFIRIIGAGIFLKIKKKDRL